MSSVLVTGGAGFLGSHLCDKLIELGNDVICLDSFFTGSKDNIRHLLTNPKFELIRHDIVEPIYLEVDQIYNLACPASPVHYQHNPIKTIKTNIMGAINVLDLAVFNQCKVLQASTSEVYGDPTVHPQTEEYWGNVNPIGIRSCYDEGKRAAECLFMDYYRQHDIAAKIVRIFNTYGPRMAIDDGRVVSNFIVQALRGEDITVYGDGTQTRSFCYVSDMIDGLITMMRSSDNYIGPVNFGNPTEFRIIDLAEKIIKMTKSKSNIKFKKLPEDDPIQRKPDIMRAGLSGWKPKIELDEGLDQTISYFHKVI